VDCVNTYNYRGLFSPSKALDEGWTHETGLCIRLNAPIRRVVLFELVPSYLYYAELSMMLCQELLYQGVTQYM